MAEKHQQKTVCFFPLNSPGHINSGLGIADRLKHDFNHRIVFLLLGPMIGDSVRKHGHELVVLDEARPYEDYEIDEDDDLCAQVSEETKERQGKRRRKFEGALKWPQLIMRYQHLFQLDPVEAFVESCHILEKSMVGELIDNHENYESALRAIGPDLIIIDAYYVPPCVMQFAPTVPWARLYSANPLMIVESKLPGRLKVPPLCGFKLYTKQEREQMRNETPPSRWLELTEQWAKNCAHIFKAMGNAGATLAKFLAKYNCEPLAPGQQAHNSPHLNIYMFPSALDYDQDDDLFYYPARWFRCDSLMRKQEQPDELDAIRFWAQQLNLATANGKQQREIIYFSLGTIASGNVRVMQRYVEILKNDKRRLYVISKGVNGHKYDLCPENMIGDDYLPQTFFLERANLAIIHGGNNSVTECMYYGLPMIVLPVFADQLDNAQRVEDLGYGRRLDVNKCTRNELLETIESILHDSDLIDRMRQLGRAVQSRDDLGKVTNLLNKLIEEKKLDQKEIDDASC